MRPTSAVALGLGLLATVVIPTPAAHADAAQVRYATPAGTPSSDCLQLTPCDLLTAVNGAAAGDDVVIEPGAYYSTADPLLTELTNPNPLTLHAASPAQIPVIYTSAGTGLSLINSDVSDVVLVSSGATDGIEVHGGAADHIAVFASAGDLGACGLYGTTLTDSVCAQTGANDPAIGISAADPGTFSNVIRNVTAVSSAGYAFAATAGSSEFSNAVSNTILNGAAGDIALATTGTGSMTVAIDHSAYRPTATDLTGGGQVIEDAGNVAAPPQFVSAATGNFEELASSPTVDAGGTAPVSDVDLANLPRKIGKAPDIGAYELAVAPIVHQFRVLKARRHSATITVAVDGQGLPTTQHVVVSSRHAGITTNETPVATGHASKLTLHRLERHRHYTVRVVAHNIGGTTTSRMRDFVTD